MILWFYAIKFHKLFLTKKKKKNHYWYRVFSQKLSVFEYQTSCLPLCYVYTHTETHICWLHFSVKVNVLKYSLILISTQIGREISEDNTGFSTGSPSSSLLMFRMPLIFIVLILFFFNEEEESSLTFLLNLIFMMSIMSQQLCALSLV